MKAIRNAAFVICGLVALAWLAHQPTFGAGEKADSKDDQAKKAVQKVLDDQVVAWNKGNLRGFMEGYWQSPELRFQSGNTMTKGWQATLDGYRKKYQAPGKQMGQLSFRELEVEMLGENHALVRGRWKVMFPAQNSEGLFTLILKKLDPGWRIVHDHTS